MNPTRLITSPIDIQSLHQEVRAMFQGMALYNTGTITVAYRQAVIFRNVTVGGEQMFARPMPFVIPPGARLVFEIDGAE